jgi:hypothetical protein
MARKRFDREQFARLVLGETGLALLRQLYLTQSLPSALLPRTERFVRMCTRVNDYLGPSAPLTDTQIWTVLVAEFPLDREDLMTAKQLKNHRSFRTSDDPLNWTPEE